MNIGIIKYEDEILFYNKNSKEIFLNQKKVELQWKYGHFQIIFLH